jgi:two-component system, cell cycle response regulator
MSQPPFRDAQSGDTRRLAVRPLQAALRTAIAGLIQSGGTDDAAESVRRLVRVLLENEVIEQQPAIVEAARTVFLAPLAELPDAATAFVNLTEELNPPASSSGGRSLLIVEDDELFARTLAAVLAAPGRRVEIVATAAEARARLAAGPVSLVVLDLILPDSDGRNILHEFRSDPRTAGLPLFVVSARLGTHTKAECFALGADAYFEKPLDLDAFAVAVSARLERHDALMLARRDGVTGLPNRAAFFEILAHMRANTEPNTPFALAVLDLDHFRWIEETWGRQFGDGVLRRAAIRLAMSLRTASCFARWDGAEFIAFFAGRSAGEAAASVEQGLEALRRVDFRQGADEPLILTFSAGVTDLHSEQDVEEAIDVADRLRYAAKTGGRNRVVVGTAAAPTPVARILLAEDDHDIVRLLTRHLRREGFEVVHAGDGEEALALFPTSGASMVISDVEMPRLDGLGFLRGLREHPAGRHLPVMMLTAMGDENYVVRAFELGADDYVLKPFSAREVTARIRRMLRRPSVAGVPAR